MGLLSRTFPPELVDFVVDEAGAREERTRSLPSRLTVYFILTVWLFTGYGYGLLLRELVEHWPSRAREIWRSARTGSLTEARQRVGHIKIEQRGGRTATLRSMSPAMVEQELWAMLCASTRPCTTWPPRAPSRPTSPSPTSASSRPSPPPDAPSARTFPPRRLTAKAREVREDLVREAVEPRPGCAAPAPPGEAAPATAP
jgi:hypothetical protein